MTDADAAKAIVPYKVPARSFDLISVYLFHKVKHVLF